MLTLWFGIERRVQFIRTCYKRFGPELHDMTTVTLALKVRVLKAEVIETLLHESVTWTLKAIHYDKLRIAHLGVLRGVLGVQRRADHTNVSYAEALKKKKREITGTTIRRRRLFFAVAMVRQGKGQLPNRMTFAQI